MAAKLLTHTRPGSGVYPETNMFSPSPLMVSRAPRVLHHSESAGYVALASASVTSRTPRLSQRTTSPGRVSLGQTSAPVGVGQAPVRERRHRKLSLPVIPQQQSLTFPIIRSKLSGATWSGEHGHAGSLQSKSTARNFHGSQFITGRTDGGGGGLRRHLAEHRGTGRQLPKIGPSQYNHSQSLDAPESTPPSAPRMRARPQSEIIELALPPGLANQKIANSTFSLPAQIDCISDVEDDTSSSQRGKDDSRLDIRKEKKRNKLTRRKAWYRQKKDGRSRSLTHIDSLDPTMMVHQDDSDRMSEPDTSGRQTGSGPHRRKKLAAHGKVVSSECFSVSFDVGSSEETPEEFVPAVKGTVLREALSHVCERHRVDIDAVSVYLENGRTPLPLLTTETYWLGGKHLRIKVRDHDNKSPVRSKSSTSHSSAPSRKASGSYRGMVSKRFTSGEEVSTFDAAAVSGSTDGSLKVSKPSKQHTRWSGIFSNSSLKESGSSKMEQMIQCLETYQCTGIPRLPYLVNFDGDASEEEELYSLESDWRELVDSPEQLSERRHQQQNAIWELVHTEAAYIHTLKVITDLFLSCLCNLQNCRILTEVDTEKLFSNIQEIYAANRHFWHDHVLRMLTKARRTRQPLDITEMRDGFSQFEEICHPYTRYCLDQNNSKLYCKSLTRSNGLFNGYLVWCETQKDCNRLRLVDILAQPWQRLTKYSLLLKAILKKTEATEEQAMLREMVQDVDLFVGSVDGSLRSRHEQERLSEIMGRIDSYDCVDTKDDELEKALKPHLSLDLTSPMPGCSEVHRRYLLFEGELKLRDNVTSKVDVRCFLFTDMLLVCKPLTKKGDKVRVIRQPYVIDRLLMQEASRDASLLCVYLNEYQCATAAFTLFCPESKHCKSWVDWVRKAQEKYREARLATINQEYVFYDDDDELEIPACALLASRSPRGSSRTSRVPSLIHSHSSSMDNSDPSGASSVMTVQTNTARAALAVAEERLVLSERSASEDTPSSKLKGSLSPKTERRPMLRSAGSTPNQLSVMAHLTPAGQSLPNLTAEAAHQLSVPPQKARHAAQRGITYPPLSPRTLRRSSAVQPSPRNPPLSRARHVTAEGGGTSPPPQQAPPTTPQQTPSLQSPAATVTDAGSPSLGEEPETDADARSRRHSRDRLENRRYHTAGAIEDMRRQEMRDASIHKRLSWNCGQQQPPPPLMGRQAQALRASRHGNACLSSDSVHSSSGVSSVNSLQLSIGSEFEEGPLSDNLEDALTADIDDSRTIVEATNLAQRLKLSPHISTTYISADELSCAGVSCVSSSVQNTESGVKIDISEAPEGVLSRVQITVNDDSATATAGPDAADGATPSSVPPSPGDEQWNQFEFLLSDNTIRASDV